MKHIHLITNFTDIGGAEVMLARYVNHVDTTQCIIVSLMGSSPLMTSKLRGTVEVINLNCTSAYDLLIAPFKLKKLIKLHNVNSIYSWMYHANFVAALVKLFPSVSARVIWGVHHSLDDLEGESKSTKLAIYVGKYLKKIPTKVIYCSTKSMQQHISFGYSFKSNSVYIPNGYEIEELKVRDFNNSFVIGAAGRFHKAKNFHMLFKAVAPILADNSNVKLRIAGRDIDHNNEAIKRYIRELSINIDQIELLGLVNDMPSFYRSVDFFVLSSITEGFPNVLAEAAGHGCIIFSTDVGDAKYIVNDDSRLVPVGQDDLLSRALVDYMNKTSDELSAISKHLSTYIRNSYSIDIISKKILALGIKK